ncbi:MAG: MarR family transcriptional regulator, partial [Acidobacteriota bacterium]
VKNIQAQLYNQWAVLSTLASDGALTLAGLARSVMVSKQNMTGMVSRLEQLDLIERNDDPDDLRSSRVTLNRRGRALVEKLRPAYGEWLAALGTDVTDRELQAAESVVHRLIEELSAPEADETALSRRRR